MLSNLIELAFLLRCAGVAFSFSHAGSRERMEREERRKEGRSGVLVYVSVIFFLGNKKSVWQAVP